MTTVSVAASSAAAGGGGLPVVPLATLGKLAAAPAPGPAGPERVPAPITKVLLAKPQTVKLGERIDGIACERTERLVYHIHVHLTIFVAGKAVAIPYGIGIGAPIGGVNTPAGPFATSGTCFMWLHTHALDGVIHVESPSKRIYTLGQFFAVWGQPLSRSRVGPDKGTVTALYGDKVWTGNPDDIPLTPHAQVQLEVGKPLIAPERIRFPKGL